MKKSFLLFCATLLVANALFAQSFTQGPRNKHFDNLMAVNSIIVGEDAQSIYLVTYKTTSILGNYKAKNILVMAVDHNLNEQRSFEIEGTKDAHLVAAAMDGNNVALLAYEFSDRELVLKRYVVNAQSMKPATEPQQLLSLNGKNCYKWSKWSDNHQYFGFMAGLVTPRKDQLEMTEVLFDSHLQQVWKQDYEMPALSDIAVGNDGTIATMGYQSGESCTRFLFGTVNQQGGHQYEAQYNFFVDPIEASLLNYTNGNFVIGGIVMSPDSHGKDKCYDRYFGLVYNSRTGQLTGKANNFNLDEVNVFGENKLDKKQKHLYADALVLTGEQPTPYGGAMAIQRKWLLEKRDANGMFFYTYFINGTMVMGVDTTGNVVWHKPIRTNLASSETPYFAGCATFVHDGNYYLLQSESKKAPATYDITEPFKPTIYPKGADRLGCYAITPDGNVNKQSYELDFDGMVFQMGSGSRILRQFGNKVFGILSLKGSSSIYSLTF